MTSKFKLCQDTKYFNLYEAAPGMYAAIENDNREAAVMQR